MRRAAAWACAWLVARTDVAGQECVEGSNCASSLALDSVSCDTVFDANANTLWRDVCQISCGEACTQPAHPFGGKSTCFDGTYTFDRCCNTAGGLVGSPGDTACWDETNTFAACHCGAPEPVYEANPDGGGNSACWWETREDDGAHFTLQQFVDYYDRTDEWEAAASTALVYDFDYCCAKSDYTAGTTGQFVVTEGGAGLVADGGCFDESDYTFDTCLCGKPLDCVGEWSDCDASCIRTYTVSQVARFGGTDACEAADGAVEACEVGTNGCGWGGNPECWTSAACAETETANSVDADKQLCAAEDDSQTDCEAVQTDDPSDGDAKACTYTPERSFESCCDTSSSPTGNADCWGDTRDFESCWCAGAVQACEGDWSTCNTTNCAQEYVVSQPSVSGGAACPKADGTSVPCATDDGQCPAREFEAAVVNSVAARLTLNGDFWALATGTERTEFENSFKADVAEELGIDAGRIEILTVAAGSTVVDFLVLPATDGTPIETSALIDAFAAAGVTIAGSTTTGPVSNMETVRSDAVPPPPPPPAAESGSPVGLVVMALVALAASGVAAEAWRRKKLSEVKPIGAVKLPPLNEAQIKKLLAQTAQAKQVMDGGDLAGGTSKLCI
eukprot:COSAG04_NODE_10_length_43369_cov_4.059025_9_plen_618_part_00